MFIGHFAFAYLLKYLVPGLLPAIVFLGVSIPDLLWPILILAGVERVSVDPDSPRQDAITFLHNYSHSLFTGTMIAMIPGILIGLIFGLIAGIVFVIAAAPPGSLIASCTVRTSRYSGSERTGPSAWASGCGALWHSSSSSYSTLSSR